MSERRGEEKRGEGQGSGDRLEDKRRGAWVCPGERSIGAF